MGHLRLITLTLCFGAVSGCGLLGLQSDPLDEVEKLSDVTLAPEAETAALVTPADQPSIFAGLMDLLRSDSEAEPVAASIVTNDTADPSDVEDAQAKVEEDPITDLAPTEESSVFGLLTNLLPDSDDIEAAPVAAAPTTTPPAFGELRVACEISGTALGTKITEASGYQVYDSQPGATTIRPHYITGFDDRCARRFDAALVLFGDIGTHELVRYARTRVKLEYSATDEAYESIKASFCGVDPGVPCGRRLDRLARDTTFVTAYETFGATPKWAEFLLHDGDVAATDIEG